jgi:hypothetical protein
MDYTPLEFRDTLQLLADGEVNAAPMVTDMPGSETRGRTTGGLGVHR